MSICYGCMKEIDKEEKVCPYCGFDGNHYETKFYQLKLGTILNDRYVIGKMLGEGGFGITYIGWDRNLEVAVAIKEYYPNGMVNRDTTEGNNTVFTMEGKKGEAFEIGMAKVISEARRMAKFRNLQGIVTVVDFFKENGTAYIVMEYVRGITFNQYLKENGVMKPEKVLTMFQPLIQSLCEVHQRGMIHRDISPDNIMIDDRNEIKLLDFGAARDYGEDEKSLSIMLKRGYAPEEQYRSKGKQGPWTDVYALCATMYKMMTGVTPEESLDRMEDDNLRSLSELSITIDSNVEHILLKGMEIYRKNRIQNMEELYEGLYGRKISVRVDEADNSVVETQKQEAAAVYTLEKLQGAVEDSANNSDMGTVVLFEDSIKEEIQMRQTENTEINYDKSENIDSENVTSVIDSKTSVDDYAAESEQQKSLTEEKGKTSKKEEHFFAIDTEQPKEAVFAKEADLINKRNNTLMNRIKSKKMIVAIGVAFSMLIAAVVLFYCQLNRQSLPSLMASALIIAVVSFYMFRSKCTVVESCYDASGNILYEGRYDKNEKMISYTSYDEDGKYEWEYDNNGNKISETHYSGDGKSEYECEYENEYDDNGNVISTIKYVDGKEVSKYEYGYNNNGNIISAIKYIDRKEISKHEYEYDNNGNKVLDIFINIDGKSEYKYDNEYDNKGNLISVTEYLDGEVNQVCKYEYK